MDFSTSDNLITHLEDTVIFLTYQTFKAGIDLQQRWPELYVNLVKITDSDLPEDEK
jgi:hypothetical protein